MDNRHDRSCSADEAMIGEHADGREEESERVAPAEKTFRVGTAIAVFGVPLVAGVAALIGYGVQKLIKAITGKGKS